MLPQPKILVVVQARMTSSRLPGKVLLPLGGKPLLVRMLERVAMAKTPVATVVATTTNPADDAIEQLCHAENIACFRGHPTDLLDRHYQAGQQWQADAVVKIPSDCPLIDPAAIDRVLGYYLTHADSVDYVSNLHPGTWPDGNDVEVMSMACLEKTWRKATRPYEREHTTPYIWDTAPDQFRIANVVWETGLNYSASHRITIDYQEDYELIRALFDALYPEKPDFGTTDIVELLHLRPDLYQLNARHIGVNWYRHHLDELKTMSKIV